MWTYLQVEIVPEDRLLRPMLGPGDLTRSQAHAAVQDILDGVPGLAPVATQWRAGAKDDTVYAGLLIWTIIEYEADRRRAALVWLDDLAATMRSAGADVQVARLPES